MTGAPMKKQNAALTISSLLSLVFTTFHLTHDNLHVAAGVDVQGTVILLVIMLVMAYGTVELAGTRLGYIIMFLGGLAAATMPFLHTLGPRAIRWGFFFVWTLYVLGLTGTFSAVVSARELWRSFRNPSP
jgi:hypothetical protein